MIQIVYGKPGEYSQLDSVPCPACHGIGVVPHDEFDCLLDCFECDGSGLVFSSNTAPSSPIPVESAAGAGAGGQPRLAPTFLPLYHVFHSSPIESWPRSCFSFRGQIRASVLTVFGVWP